jgi:hypothetical protein
VRDGEGGGWGEGWRERGAEVREKGRGGEEGRAMAYTYIL